MGLGMPWTRTDGRFDIMANLLEVKDLKTRFHTAEGVVYAVNGISFHVDEGETLAVKAAAGNPSACFRSCS
jgi:ABC-type microcin C transport system duplicated ATPase subunit YejF